MQPKLDSVEVKEAVKLDRVSNEQTLFGCRCIFVFVRFLFFSLNCCNFRAWNLQCEKKNLYWWIIILHKASLASLENPEMWQTWRPWLLLSTGFGFGIFLAVVVATSYNCITCMSWSALHSQTDRIESSCRHEIHHWGFRIRWRIRVKSCRAKRWQEETGSVWKVLIWISNCNCMMWNFSEIKFHGAYGVPMLLLCFSHSW